ncbi:glycoside hydrolase family 3 C-terminal domain-containing protein [Marinomonas ostreistagni]|nr:glycoside hydrolase family 3 C-terminal domain-containing protein [Marinomonas ostreistagni]
MMQTEQIAELLAELTNEEKAQLCAGKDFWSLHGIERLGLPSIMMTDGPHGLRKQTGAGDHVGLNGSVPATCFPTASATAATWNPALIKKMGQALGAECRAQNVSVLLGPGTNLKRHPLGGRNFEYFSEDPRLGADFSSAWIDGVQSQQVGASLKHFAVNNHESGRMTVDAIIDERTLRELYLPAFEQAIKASQPWTVMCSYNKINGTYAAEHKQLLQDILVDEWGFDGIVVTDWGANNDRVAGLNAGQTLEMPGSGERHQQQILAALEHGELSQEALDFAVSRLLGLYLKAQQALEAKAPKVDLEAHHKLARQVAEEACVLLKNDAQLLPAKTGQKVAVIGALAEQTRYQGAGSSKINPSQLEQPLEQIQARFGADQVSFAPGYALDDQADQAAIDEAVALAEAAEVVFVFAGLTPRYESEGFDREHLNLPQNQLDLIEALAAEHHKVVVILQNGAPVAMPFAESVGAILESYLGGQAGASAVTAILAGDVNPSGKLAETFPLALEDIPSTPYFPGNGRQVQYREAIWVGYRYFDSADEPVLFPFGHGLSYAEFEYSDLSVEVLTTQAQVDQPLVKVSFTLTNTSTVAGAETAQIYIGQSKPSVPRPKKSLAGYEKVWLEPSESKQVEILLDGRAFAYWDVTEHNWKIEQDGYQIMLASSVADVRLKQSVILATGVTNPAAKAALAPYFTPRNGDFDEAAFTALLGHGIPQETPIQPYGMNSTVADIANTTVGKEVYTHLLEAFGAMMGGDQNSGAAEADRLMAEAMVKDMPLRNLAVFTPNLYNENDVMALINRLNQ